MFFRRHEIRLTSNDGAEVDVVGQVLNVSHIGSSREKGVQQPESNKDDDTCFLFKFFKVKMSKALFKTPSV